MNRLLIVSAVAAGACAIAAPAVAGLAGNPSFSHRVPVRVPSQAKVVQFDDHGRMVGEGTVHTHPYYRSAPSPTPTARGHEPEPGDLDRGGDRTSSPVAGGETTSGHDRDRSLEPEPGDLDRGGDHGSEPEPGDPDHRGGGDSGSGGGSGRGGPGSDDDGGR